MRNLWGNAFVVSASLCAATSALALAGVSQRNLPEQVPSILDKPKVCPNYEAIKNICSLVNTQSADDDPNSPFDYLYQNQMHEAACADPRTDTPEVVLKKIRAAWTEFGDKLICDSFGLQKESVVKYAVDKNFDSFIEDVAHWKVGLNKVGNDGLTVLDYIEREQLRPNSPLLRANLSHYREVLLAAGARRRGEVR